MHAFSCFRLGILRPALKSTLAVAVGRERHGGCIVGVECEGLFQVSNRLRQALLGKFVFKLLCAQHQVVGVQVGCRLALQAFYFGTLDVRLNYSDDAFCDAVLQIEDVTYLTFEPIRPDVGCSLCIDQLADEPKPVPAAPYAALKNVAHAELTADLPDIDGLALVGER